MSTKLLIAVVLIAAASPALAGSATQRDAPTTRFYTPDGRSVGSATTYGNQTRFYGPDGRSLGTVTTTPSRGRGEVNETKGS
jgi:hypothetical protein